MMHKKRQAQGGDCMRFKGKISGWFYAATVSIAAVCVPNTIASLGDKEIVSLAICLLVFIGLELFCIPITFHNYVELQNDKLLIVFGFIRKKIPYSDIVTLSTTNNPSSSLAASLDRIEIKRKNKSEIMIAVIDKEGFFNEIKKNNIGIIILSGKI